MIPDEYLARMPPTNDRSHQGCITLGVRMRPDLLPLEERAAQQVANGTYAGSLDYQQMCSTGAISVQNPLHNQHLLPENEVNLEWAHNSSATGTRGRSHRSIPPPNITPGTRTFRVLISRTAASTLSAPFFFRGLSLCSFLRLFSDDGVSVS